MKIRIASRESRLAMWQAEHVKNRLLALPEVSEVHIIGMTTRGDQILDQSLSKIGGKGLFIKELEHALLRGDADLAVHSGKDIPMSLEPEFALLGFMTREDPRDAWVSNTYARLVDLPKGALVGSSSLRRQAQILANFPHLIVQPLRGNLDTRLSKLDAGQFDGIVLAAAGLKRLGLDQRIRDFISPEDMLPAVGQGALGLEVRADDVPLAAVVQSLIDPICTPLVSAEREVSRALGGSCQVPLAAHTTLLGSDQFHLKALVVSVDGRHSVQAQAQGALHDWQFVAQQVVQTLKTKGAEALVNQA